MVKPLLILFNVYENGVFCYGGGSNMKYPLENLTIKLNI